MAMRSERQQTIRTDDVTIHHHLCGLYKFPSAASHHFDPTMTACLDQRRRLSHGGGELDLDPAVDQGIELRPADSDPSASSDFGGLVRHRPAAVVRPSSVADVASVILLAARSDRLTVAPRGNGHSLHGQAMADGGVVLNMRALAAAGRMELVAAGDVAAADVPGGALWEDVLTWAVHSHGLTPPSWTDYLGLTVGGTLSNGGISGQSFRHGPQISNVIELEVVTGDGERHVCSAVTRADLFFAVLGGLGQFGVITRARIPLIPAPEMVRWMRVVYSRFEEYSADAERLVGRTGDTGFDYVEGFAFVNRDDPVNGWGSVSIRPGTSFDSSRIPAGSGPVLYCLEVALNYRRGEETLVGKRASEMMRQLRYVRGLEFTADVGYVEFLSRVKLVEEEARANGSWAAPHPWLNLLISSGDILDFDRKVFKYILRDGIGGPMLVYPLLRSKWDQRTSVALPDSELFYLVALLRFGLPYPDGPSAEEMLAQNGEIVRVCDANRYDYKLYLPHYESETEWAGHFGRGWNRFVERKSRYDPLSILAPGQKIFSRARLAAGSSR